MKIVVFSYLVGVLYKINPNWFTFLPFPTHNNKNSSEFL